MGYMGSYYHILKATFYLLKKNYRMKGVRVMNGLGFRVEDVGYFEDHLGDVWMSDVLIPSQDAGLTQGPLR